VSPTTTRLVGRLPLVGPVRHPSRCLESPNRIPHPFSLTFDAADNEEETPSGPLSLHVARSHSHVFFFFYLRPRAFVAPAIYPHLLTHKSFDIGLPSCSPSAYSLVRVHRQLCSLPAYQFRCLVLSNFSEPIPTDTSVSLTIALVHLFPGLSS
jgi:hypothetical protein